MTTSKKLKVLYLAPYSVHAYGAEEQDIECGWKLLQSMKNIDAHYVKIDLQSKKLITTLDTKKSKSKLKFRDICKYLFNLLSTPDNAMRQAYSFFNYKLITQLIIDLRVDIIFTNTTSTVLFGNQSRVKHIFRSVSFEPIYALKTVDNYFIGLIHSLLKLLSVFQELRADFILAISPRDAGYYRIVSLFKRKKKIIVIPLRQFIFRRVPKEYLNKHDSLNVAFMGSTYNVLHNKKSFNFIYKKINFIKLSSQNINVNIYGRKIPPTISSTVNLRIHNYVKNINSIYRNNQVFLVPYFLSSGMQSKVFEPLFYGRILVCDPRVLAGYNFKAFVHYIPAKSPEDFMQALIWIRNNPKRGLLIANKARAQSYQLFTKSAIQEKIRLVLDLDRFSHNSNTHQFLNN